MKKPYDISDNGFDSSDFFAAALNSAAGRGGDGAPDQGPATGSPVAVPEEELEAEAAIAQSGPGGAGSTVAVGSSAGLTINLIFDQAAMNAPQSFRDGVTQAMAMICAAVTDHITINLQIDYSGTGQGAAGGPSGGLYEPYSTVHADLVNNASPGDTIFNSLPTGSTIGGQSQVAVWNSQLKLWGLMDPNGTEIDGSATFATDINPNLLVGVALHELTHAMGRVPYGPSPGQPSITQPDIFDFYRFTSPGNILINGGSTAAPAYFSLDNGAHKIADYGQTSDPSDFLNSGVQGSTDPFDEFYSNNTQQQLTAIDLQQLDALGFHLAINSNTVIEALGSTSLVQTGSNFYFNPVAGGTGPELKYNGSAFVANSTFASWAPIGVEAISGGYEVALKTGANYSVWNTDTNGNLTSVALATTTASSTALETLETSFHQDLNGDGIIGLPSTPPPSGTIEAFGSTALVQTGSNYFLNPVAGGTGPELKFGGVPFTAGSTFGSWAAIGAEAISGGYEVAFKTGADNYTVWNTDTNGNLTTNALPTTSGSSTALETIETSFQQDLNGDHIIGVPSSPPPTGTIEAFGSTALVQTGSNYFFNPVAGGTGPELKYGGTAFVAGSTWGGWAPIGVEAISGGYEVAFKTGANYTVWNTDSNGNVTTNALATTTGSSTALETLETSFHQDLNGDHIIGVPAPTLPAAQVSNTAPAAPLFDSDAFVFRSSLGQGSDPGGLSPPAPPQQGGLVVSAIEYAGRDMQHVVADAHDPGWSQDGTVHTPLPDPLHGFIIH